MLRLLPLDHRVRRLLPLICLLGAVACTPQPRQMQPPDILACQPMPPHPSASLCAIQPGNAYSLWFLVDDGMVQQLPIDMLEANLAGFSISPSGNFVAFISTGEGHPLVQLYFTGMLLSDGRIEYLQGWDPYPGYIDIAGWEGDDLILVSDMPLHTDYDRYADIIDTAEYHFRWNVAHPKLELIKKIVAEAGPDFPIIYFPDDSLSLPDAEKEKLDRVAVDLQREGSPDLTLVGHTDERGTEGYNLAQGERMARVVRDYLVIRGVAGGKLTILSLGESSPIDPGHDEAAWRSNRRVELVWEP